WIGDDLGARPMDGAWYAGEPLLVTANDRAQEVYNGDSGVVIADGDSLAAVFERGDQVKRLHPSQLGDVVPVYAMTIHRSQGSQFSEVTVVLPPADAELLTRELLYTAITRARDRVRIVGTPDALRAAVGRRVARASGLRTQLREVGG
ncbi:ATP-dependent RecD-like DNA helicase, partial [Gordonia sp. HY442]